MTQTDDGYNGPELLRIAKERAAKDCPVRLIVMRLADMQVVHPKQDNSRVCMACGEGVGIYPSGQAAIRHDPSAEIVCNHCQGSVEGIDLAPGALIEPFESVKK